jgi:hypothetical protein
MLRERHAVQGCERALRLIELELDHDAPRRHLDALVELAMVHLAETGGSLVTASLRGQLVAAKAEVATRTNLRAVSMAPTPPQKARPPMSELEIAAAAQCHCGHNVTVSYVPLGRCWQAVCENCYDGTEDAGALAHCTGHGETPDEALSEWQERHEDLAEVEYWPHPTDLAWLVKVEARRQRGWVTLNGYWGPAIAAANHNG